MRNLWLAAAALGLTACGGAAPDRNAANEAAPANAAAETPSDNSAAVAAVSREGIVGAWTTDGDCSTNPYRFEDDNSIYRHGGNEVGTWALKDNRIALDLDDPPGKGTAEMNAGGAMVTSLNGQSLTFTRC
jgi:hypothetical protein